MNSISKKAIRVGTGPDIVYAFIDPYLLIYEKDSPYCIVSEGSDPCLEDEDF